MNIKLPKISVNFVKNKNNKIDGVIVKYTDYQKIIATMDKLKKNIQKLKKSTKKIN